MVIYFLLHTLLYLHITCSVLPCLDSHSKRTLAIPESLLRLLSSRTSKLRKPSLSETVRLPSCPLSGASLTSFFFYLVQRQVTICSSALDACKNAEAVVIATEWKEFKEIDWEKVYEGMNKPAFIFDGRLLLNADELRKIGFRVKTIGRGEKF